MPGLDFEQDIFTSVTSPLLATLVTLLAICIEDLGVDNTPLYSFLCRQQERLTYGLGAVCITGAFER